MRNAWGVLALTLVLPRGITAQAARPVELLGRPVELRLSQRAPDRVRGELLAVRRDSAWVLSDAPRRVVGVRIVDISQAVVRRHGLTPRKGLLWGLGVGLASGLGLTAACGSVEGTSCGGVLPAALLSGLLYGGIAAISYHSSSRWSFEPVSAETIAPFARFPQGPPAGVSLDELARPRPDSQAVRARPLAEPR
jgi:hypothetical protein